MIIEDTAIGAERLKDGEYDSSIGVVCSKHAGLERGLFLLAENIEDQKDNRTEFRMFKKPERRFVRNEHLSSPILSSEVIYEKLIQGFLIAMVLGATWYITHFDMSAWATALTISGYVLALYWIINVVNKWLFVRAFVGYWKYYPIAKEDEDKQQQHQIPRLVSIIEEHGEFRLKIYTPSVGNSCINAISEYVYVTKTDSCSGKFIYKYKTNDIAVDVAGISILSWKRNNPLTMVKDMEGDYFGIKSKETGLIVFHRISKIEFDRISVSTFL